MEDWKKNRDEGGRSELDLGPPWLVPMLKGNYFIPCSVHGGLNKSECNMFCLDCVGDAFCPYCLTRHRDHRVLQVIPPFQYVYCSLFTSDEVQKSM